MMNFKLSAETRKNLQVSTGHDYATLTTRPLSSFHAVGDSSNSRLASSHPRIIKPRGSVYLQLGRILHLSEVRRFIFKK